MFVPIETGEVVEQFHVRDIGWEIRNHDRVVRDARFSLRVAPRDTQSSTIQMQHADEEDEDLEHFHGREHGARVRHRELSRPDRQTGRVLIVRALPRSLGLGRCKTKIADGDAIKAEVIAVIDSHLQRNHEALIE